MTRQVVMEFDENLIGWATKQQNRSPGCDTRISILENGAALMISSTLSKEETINLLDRAMEAIDGQRLPPEENAD